MAFILNLCLFVCCCLSLVNDISSIYSNKGNPNRMTEKVALTGLLPANRSNIESSALFAPNSSDHFYYSPRSKSLLYFIVS